MFFGGFFGVFFIFFYTYEENVTHKKGHKTKLVINRSIWSVKVPWSRRGRAHANHRFPFLFFNAELNDRTAHTVGYRSKHNLL